MEEKEGYERKKFEDTVNLKNSSGKWLSKTQISKLIKPDFGEDCIARTVDSIAPIRTARMSISEKAMCPRECDQKKKKKTSRKRKLPQSTTLQQEARSPVSKKLHESPSSLKENDRVVLDSVTNAMLVERLKSFAAGSHVANSQVNSPEAKLPFLVSPSTQALLQSLGPLHMYNSMYQMQLIQQLQQQQQQQQQQNLYPMKLPNQVNLANNPLVQDFRSRLASMSMSSALSSPSFNVSQKLAS